MCNLLVVLGRWCPGKADCMARVNAHGYRFLAFCNRLLVLIVSAPLLICAAVPPAGQLALFAPRFHPNRMLVKPKSGNALTATPLTQLHNRSGAKVLKTFPGIAGLQLLELPAGA